MVGIIKRFNRLNKLLNLQYGPGAAVLPQNISRIHMDFNRHIENGHAGPRKFWKENLRRLKFHNPQIPMIVNRRPRTTPENATRAIMTLFFRRDQPPSATAAPGTSSTGSSAMGTSPVPKPSDQEYTVQIDMTNRNSADILASFMEETRATPIIPSAEATAQLRAVEDMEAEAVVDRARMKQKTDEERREKAMLERARKDLAGA